MVNYLPIIDNTILDSAMIQRRIESKILDALNFSPVVFLAGARQTGKSTLAQAIAKKRNLHYVTLDDLTILQAARNDPQGFISSYARPIVIDEVQRVPQLLLEIKRQVDTDRKPGQFFLTGSANALMLPKVADALVGRIVIFTLFPFSYDEIHGFQNRILDHLSVGIRLGNYPEFNRKKLIDIILTGGYPEVLKIKTPEQKRLWFQSYISTILQRDIRDLSRIEGVYELPRLLTFLSYQTGSLMNLSNLSRELGIPLMTLKRYVSLLETIFLIHRLPAWFSNIGKRLIKTPKVFFNDSGLLAYLLGLDESVEENDKLFGQLFENFIFQELTKQISWNSQSYKLFYFRTASGKETDFVLETQKHELIGIEVKLKQTIQSKDFDGLRELKKLTRDRFKAGYVLFLGDNAIPFGDNLFTLPISAFLGIDSKRA